MTAKRIRVLLVEDNPADVRLLRAVVDGNSDALPFDHANCLAEAFQRMADCQYDVILLDLYLPDSDGIGTVVRFREAAADVPIVVLTGTDDEATGVRVIQAGADEYLPKADMHYGALIRCIRHALERHRMSASLREKEEQLRHSQKMQAVGQLAAGVAHEFNNLMQAILGYVGFALDEIAPNHAAHQDLAKLQRVAQRGAKLTRQLLIFSRQAEPDMAAVDLNGLIKDLTNLLRTAIGAQIELRVVPGDDVGVTADATLLQQVLMNLCLNARDAMPEGGILTVRTERDRERREVLMQVSDTGGGIPPEFRERIFEPFFTTKEVGKGTGLGLATVYTIVEQHVGRIDVDSEVGAGTTFTVRLPAAETVVDGCGNGEQQPSDRGDEVILVAEDDYFVRDWVVRVLKRAGYKVHVAADGAEAIEVFQAQCAEIDLVLLDYILPGVTGAVVHERLAQLHADIPFVICTAYDARSPQTEYVRANQIEMLQKPYDKHTLLATIRRVLDHRHGRIGAAIAGGRAI